MKCRVAEGMVNRYIDHSLSVGELEEFLEHIRDCSSCRDELETYFIVHEAMQQLDEEDGESVLDFKALLEQDIKKSRRYIRKKKLFHVLAGVGVLLLITGLVAFLFFVIVQIRSAF